ncbi:similar to Saccharomyces cerevisiae YDR485C VPS72 Htz1p-binding component of the SWR1 complex, which exchanges histone variant H2AZ (Htz1p) for chromatin-bound histone H2A [Maudiozyma saulgeensis]|uniref:Similar to Saccharomyces cerevisiae YDR485C VPS72 Htz1p-binding component of the SWR1 complex, which exchanges histone variant H2AZ (Htz1p) for chromatin-bound histone H2A n=1 Tax=Maudiozyma saulgeensis TaxID=1789683 RepID=A0A1X7R1S8_9SACH|nr:similar to Saccharomyces cerevisiae YDR485C VPS72 Htz1p-binding component of the SWR1 complex, which exchanges histone variant H2AZ (Htz1p) for chromatin-bound histone H2A [Kazachstania saulgeensis]
MTELHSLPDSDSEVSEPEYLMNTRERRSNAGNKMRALLEQELGEMQKRTDHFDQDELDLLFKEDEEDEDFDVQFNGSRKSKSVDESETEVNQDEDMAFSSDSDNDEETVEESDEEAAILKEEKLQQRKRQKRKRTANIIKKKSSTKNDTTSEQPIKKRRYDPVQLNPESLLQAERRTSKRSSVVANKLKVYENLSQAEEKRKIIQERLRKTREKAIEHILTQEDRMRIALETEKFNLLSLNKYKELELSKKQSRLALQQRQKLKFKPQEIVETLLSTSWNVSPEVEIEDEKYWSEELKKREKKKRKYVRRAKKKDTEDSIDPKDTNNLNTKSSNSLEGVGQSETLSTQPTEGNNDIKNVAENAEPDPKIKSAIPSLSITSEETKNNDQTKETHLVTTPETEIQTESNSSPKPDNNISETIEETNASKTLNEQSSTMHDSSIKLSVNSPDVANSEKGKKQVSFNTEPSIAIIENEPNHSSLKNEISLSPGSPISSNENTPPSLISAEVDDVEEPKPVYQGPVQQVSKNFITKFSITPNLAFSTELESPNFFDYLNPDRDQHVSDTFKPLIKSRISDSDLLFETDGIENEKIELVPNLDILTTFRMFGEFDRKFEKVLKATEVKNEDLKITTAAPMGIYTSNNNVKKSCLINNRSCKYFDPKLGVPYSDLTSYKIIQDLQNSAETMEYQWFGFKNGGIYLKVKERHARGVPEGF